MSLYHFVKKWKKETLIFSVIVLIKSKMITMI